MNIGTAETTVPTGPPVWGHLWGDPPADLSVRITPPDQRARAAAEIAVHVARELEHGRSLYCIVRDGYVHDRIGGFDGRALPSACLPDPAPR